MLDLDEKDGHPCDEQGRCLIGYACVDGACVKTDVGIVECDPACGDGTKCDLRTGICVAPCDATVCPLGTTCTGDGTCERQSAGLGAPCTTDDQCAGAVPGCSTDPANPGRLLCTCLVPAGAGWGSCVGIPSQADDCDACGEAACVTGRFSNQGLTSLCLASGQRTCAGEVDCADADNVAHCTLFGWGEDPSNRAPGAPPTGSAPLGWLSACASPLEGATLPPGSVCDPTTAGACEAGLCLPTAGGEYVCTRACTEDRDCSGVAAGRCVAAPVEATLPSGTVFDVASVCGSAPTLGAACVSSGDVTCGTDAPWCQPLPDGTASACSRACLDDGDCAADQGFTCRASGQCF